MDRKAVPRVGAGKVLLQGTGTFINITITDWMTAPEVTAAWDQCSSAATVSLCHLQASHNFVFCTSWAFSVTPTKSKSI